MTKAQKFRLLGAIADYLERHIEGIDLTYIADFANGTGTISIYWFTDENTGEVDLMIFDIANDGQIVDLPLSLEEWSNLAPPVRAFVRAFNHIVRQTMDAASYADGLIERQGAQHG